MTETILYNFKSTGFGTLKMYDGARTQEGPNGNTIVYNLLNKTTLTKNLYNYYE